MKKFAIILCLVAVASLALFIVGNVFAHFKSEIDLDKSPQEFDYQMKMYYIGSRIRTIAGGFCFVTFIGLIIVVFITLKRIK